MKKRVAIEFEVDTDEYEDVEENEDVFVLVAGMLDGFADFPDPEHVTIKIGEVDAIEGGTFANPVVRNAHEVLVEIDAAEECVCPPDLPGEDHIPTCPLHEFSDSCNCPKCDAAGAMGHHP